MDDERTILSPEAILIAEFEYARGTALQANEDRARVASYFLATGGSIVAATLGVTGEQDLNPYSAVAFAALFGLLVYVGWLTIEQLIRLRLAWRESCLAMNQVKSVFVAAHPSVQDGLRWSDESLPSAYSAASVSSLLSRVVAAITGLATVAGVAIVWRFGTDVLADVLDRSLFPLLPLIGAMVALVAGLMVGLAARHRYVAVLRATDASEDTSSSAAA